MGYRIVRITGELLECLFTDGRTFPDPDGRILRVTKGLPEGAKLVEMMRDTECFYNATFLMKFEHPSWEETPVGDRIPEVRIEHAWEEIPALTISPTLTDEQIRDFTEQIQKSAIGSRRFVALPQVAELDLTSVTVSGLNTDPRGLLPVNWGSTTADSDAPHIVGE